MNVEEFIKQTLCKGGIQDAASVAVTFKTGEVVTIHGSDHPALSRPADEVAGVVPHQTAQGGR